MERRVSRLWQRLTIPRRRVAGVGTKPPRRWALVEGGGGDRLRGRRGSAAPPARRRALLLAIALLLSVSAFLAIGILLVGRFGSVDGRILGSTALLAGYGLVALPAVVLLDKARSAWLARAAAALDALAALLALAAIWSRSGSDVLGRTVGSATIVALAFAQLAAMTARRGARDPLSVQRLFAASSATAALVAAFAMTLLWVAPGSGDTARFLGALLVLDLLLVALQPLLARARAGRAPRRLTVVMASGERIEVEVAGGDLASAAARAIRAAERADGSVVELKIAPLGDRRAAPGVHSRAAAPTIRSNRPPAS